VISPCAIPAVSHQSCHETLDSGLIFLAQRVKSLALPSKTKRAPAPYRKTRSGLCWSRPWHQAAGSEPGLNALPIIAIIGGTGKLGQGLAFRLAQRDYPVVIGSREAEKAEASAAELGEHTGKKIAGAGNPEAAARADIVILTVPWSHHRTTLDSIREAVQGKIVVDSTVPLVPPDITRVQLPAAGAAALQAQTFLGKEVRVVSAFQNVAAANLLTEQDEGNCDVLVCGNDAEARGEVVRLSEAIGLRAWEAGPIENSIAAEALSSVLIFLNRSHKIRGAGIRITGQPGPVS
jgi:NADPH-dependent F420 reductase